MDNVVMKGSIPKICDFGLSFDYENSSNALLDSDKIARGNLLQWRLVVFVIL